MTIHFEAPLTAFGSRLILRLPEEASKVLPSRGQVSVEGRINGREFQAVLEPDGDFGHWMRVDKALQKIAGIAAGDDATLEIEPTKDWPEPDVPEDFARALRVSPPKVQDKWRQITPMARWEWVRWVNATASSNTRAARIEKSVSKLSGQHRRPCCFNLAACTDPELSKNGKLRQPAPGK